MHKRMNFSTEIRETFGKQCVKVYFIDDSIAKDAKEVVERLNVIKTHYGSMFQMQNGSN